MMVWKLSSQQVRNMSWHCTPMPHRCGPTFRRSTQLHTRGSQPRLVGYNLWSSTTIDNTEKHRVDTLDHPRRPRVLCAQPRSRQRSVPETVTEWVGIVGEKYHLGNRSMAMYPNGRYRVEQTWTGCLVVLKDKPNTSQCAVFVV